jgi:hypothetical protein
MQMVSEQLGACSSVSDTYSNHKIEYSFIKLLQKAPQNRGAFFVLYILIQFLKSSNPET